jgi:hypothetical protein
MNEIEAKALIRVSCDILNALDFYTHTRMFESKELAALEHKYLTRAWKFLKDNGVNFDEEEADDVYDEPDMGADYPADSTHRQDIARASK